ncbi:MAG: PcfJ domain-containing protein [Oscillospiraceae bacterium]|nr:PcfJ domain-containing protein [Oscillospiraceae bacterium]
MGPECNIGAIEGAALFAQMESYLSAEEEEQLLPKFTPYCFYESWGGKTERECFCTVCNHYFTIYKDECPDFFRGHHNDHGYCPECGADVQLKSLGKSRTGTSLRESIAAAFIRPGPEGGIFISAGIAFREFSLYHDCHPFVEYIEKNRYYLAPGRVKGWKRSIYHQWARACFGCGDWTETVRINEAFHRNPLYGYDNDYWLFGTEHLESSAFRYCQIEDWYHEITANWLCECESTVKLCISYLAHYAMKPQMEMAVKMGLGDLCTDLCEGNANSRDVNWRAKTPDSFLRLSKADTKQFLRTPSMGLLRALHIARKEGYKAGAEQLNKALHTVGRIGFNELIYCAHRCGVSIEKALDYTSGHGRGGLGLWKDFLDMAGKLGYDLSRRDVCMPHDLQERHDAAAQTLKIEADAKAEQAYKKRYKALCKKYEFEMDGYRVMVPVSAAEIVREGKTLNHCVGGYAARHVEGKTTILFFRRSRKPGTSFITIEMTGTNGDRIMQIHGYQNERYKGSVDPQKRYAHFLNTWLDWLRSGSKRDAAGKPIIKEVKTA